MKMQRNIEVYCTVLGSWDFFEIREIDSLPRDPESIKTILNYSNDALSEPNKIIDIVLLQHFFESF